jgi:hypothetical protein
MKGLANLLVRSLAAAAFAGPSFAARAQAVTVTLSPETQEVVQGEAPRLEVLVRANEPVRAVDLARRPDVAQRLAKVRLAGLGQMDDMPENYLDLGPMSDADYVPLAPGATLAFTTRGEPFKLAILAPGEYTVYLRYRADFPSPIVESSRVKFRVLPPKADAK